MDGQAQLSTSPRIRAKRIFKEKEGAKGSRQSLHKQPLAYLSLRFKIGEPSPLSYVKNNVVTQDGPPCSGLSADMIGLRPITSHALQRHIPSCCTAFGLPLGASRLAFFKWCCGATRSTVAEPYACEA